MWSCILSTGVLSFEVAGAVDKGWLHNEIKSVEEVTPRGNTLSKSDERDYAVGQVLGYL